MKPPEFKVYLGDSVYVKFDGYYIWLTTQNGYPDDPRNQIALEPSVFQALLDWHKRVMEILTAKKSDEETL